NRCHRGTTGPSPGPDRHRRIHRDRRATGPATTPGMRHRAGLVLRPRRGTRAHTRANPTTALVAMTPGGGETWQRKEDAARSRGGTTAGTVCSIAAVTLSGTASTT